MFTVNWSRCQLTAVSQGSLADGGFGVPTSQSRVNVPQFGEKITNEKKITILKNQLNCFTDNSCCETICKTHCDGILLTKIHCDWLKHCDQLHSWSKDETFILRTESKDKSRTKVIHF